MKVMVPRGTLARLVAAVACVLHGLRSVSACLPPSVGGLAQGLCSGGAVWRAQAAAAVLRGGGQGQLLQEGAARGRCSGTSARAGPGRSEAAPLPCGVYLLRPPVLALRGAGTHDGQRKKRRKIAAKLEARDSVQALREAAVQRAKRAKEKEAFRARMARRRQEREMAEQEEAESEDDGAGLRYAMTLPAEERQVYGLGFRA